MVTRKTVTIHVTRGSHAGHKGGHRGYTHIEMRWTKSRSHGGHPVNEVAVHTWLLKTTPIDLDN